MRITGPRAFLIISYGRFLDRHDPAIVRTSQALVAALFEAQNQSALSIALHWALLEPADRVLSLITLIPRTPPAEIPHVLDVLEEHCKVDLEFC